MPSRKQTKRPTRRSSRPAGAVSRSQPNPFPTAPAGAELKLMYGGINDQQIYHNVPLTVFNATSLLDAIAVGTAPYQRIGHQVTLKEIAFRFLLNNKDNRPNVTYRLTVVAIPGVSSSSDAFGEVFASASTSQPINAFLQPGVGRILHDHYIAGGNFSVTPLTSGGTVKERSFHYQCRIPMNQSVRYNTDNVATTRLIVWLNAYDAYGTLTTDNIASLPNATYALYFTDA